MLNCCSQIPFLTLFFFFGSVKLKEVSAFITELTTITNSDLSTALSWEETLQEAEKWLKKNQVTSSNTIMVTDGNWDLNTMLPQQLSMTNTSLSPDMETLFRHWINLKLKFRFFFLFYFFFFFEIHFPPNHFPTHFFQPIILPHLSQKKKKVLKFKKKEMGQKTKAQQA